MSSTLVWKAINLDLKPYITMATHLCMAILHAYIYIFLYREIPFHTICLGTYRHVHAQIKYQSESYTYKLCSYISSDLEAIFQYLSIQ